MNRRLLTSGLVALLALTTLSACFPVPQATPHDQKPSVEASEEATEEPIEEETDAPVSGDYTPDQVVMLDAFFVATTGLSFTAASDLIGAEVANAAADQYLVAAEGLCTLDVATRTSAATHDAFVGASSASGDVTVETAEAMWAAMIAYCATLD
jgi:hypothetical protein